MKLRWGRHAGAGLAAAAGAMALVMLVASPATASPVFCGAARGRTAEIAIQGAFDDAQNSAFTEGYYGECTMVGEPEISEVFDYPYFGHIFFAAVSVTCES